MDGRWFFRVLWAVVLIAVLVGAGVMVYNYGVAQGMAAQGTLPAQPDAQPGPGFYPGFRYGYGPFFRPWGFGFFPFGFLFPLLFFFLIFALIRGLFFRGWGGPPRHWGGHDVPPAFDEWHRRAHERQENQAEG